MRERLVLSRILLDGLVERARESAPREIVGDLFVGEDGRAARWKELPNESQEPYTFYAPPAAREAARGEAAERGERLLAELHSHPTDLPIPSTPDFAGAGRCSLHAILSLFPLPALRAWRIFDDQALPVPVEIE